MADLDRTTYLDRVADRLHLDPETEAEVLDELHAHLDDSTRNLMLAGFAPDELSAERSGTLATPTPWRTVSVARIEAHGGSWRP